MSGIVRRVPKNGGANEAGRIVHVWIVSIPASRSASLSPTTPCFAAASHAKYGAGTFPITDATAADPLPLCEVHRHPIRRS